MTEYVASISFPDRNATYAAYSSLKNNGPSLGVSGLVIVERAEDGRLSVSEADNPDAGVLTAGGSLIGILVGALGGPLGLLLGFGAGALGGSLAEADRADDEDDIITRFGRSIPLGGNVILAETEEEDTSALDKVVQDEKGTISREPLADVVSELEAQREAAAEAEKAARKALREQRSREWSEDIKKRVQSLRDAFTSNDDKKPADDKS